jgi:gamma-glutamyltranspeptidase/glutathione hydrolase
MKCAPNQSNSGLGGLLAAFCFLVPCSIAGADGGGTESGMVAAAHPLATEAGIRTLREGGNAVDAAIATAFALNVVEPDAGGIGGGGFLVLFDAGTGSIRTIDFREKAPSRMQPRDYMEDGVFKKGALKYGGPSVGVPGMLKGMKTAHSLYGRLPFEALLQPAIKLAENGYPITEKMSVLLNKKAELLRNNPAASQLFLVEDQPMPAGHILVQPDMARTLGAIAREGLSAIYGESGAKRIAQAAQHAGGVLSAGDIVRYEITLREPVANRYRQFDIFAMGPPSRGGIVMLQTLKILEPFPISSMNPKSPEFLALLIGALFEAYQSGDRNVADPDTIKIDLQGLLSDAWADAARERIGIPVVPPDRVRAAATTEEAAPAPEAESVVDDSGNTTHLSTVDHEGNAVALTVTLNYHFGSGIAVPGMGILLNNELDDFSLETGHINVPAPGKIPRSNMTPTVVLRNGRTIATLGSPGGGRIPGALVNILLHKIDFGMHLDDAIEAPRIYVDIEGERILYESRISRDALLGALRILGDPLITYQLEEKPAFDRYFGGAHGIWLEGDENSGISFEGGADSRRDGVALAL